MRTIADSCEYIHFLRAANYKLVSDCNFRESYAFSETLNLTSRAFRELEVVDLKKYIDGFILGSLSSSSQLGNLSFQRSTLL